MRFILFFADVLLTNTLCNKLIKTNFYNTAQSWSVLSFTHRVHPRRSVYLKAQLMFIDSEQTETSLSKYTHEVKVEHFKNGTLLLFIQK